MQYEFVHRVKAKTLVEENAELVTIEFTVLSYYASDARSTLLISTA